MEFLEAFRCPQGHELELLGGPRQYHEDDPESETSHPREPAYCGSCQAYFWVEYNPRLILVRNAMLDVKSDSRPHSELQVVVAEWIKQHPMFDFPDDEIG